MSVTTNSIVRRIKKLLRDTGELRGRLGVAEQGRVIAISQALLDLQFTLLQPESAPGALLQNIAGKLNANSAEFMTLREVCANTPANKKFLKIARQLVDLQVELLDTRTPPPPPAQLPPIPALVAPPPPAPASDGVLSSCETPLCEELPPPLSSPLSNTSVLPESAAAKFPPPVKPGKLRRFLNKFGGSAFTISLAVHAGFIALAIFVITSVHIEPVKMEEISFATGAGGGNRGKNASLEHRVQMRQAVKNQPRQAAKLVARGSAGAVLPDMADLRSSLLARGGSNSRVSKGFGGGTGGGIGGGIGPGRGGSNMVGVFKPEIVMGVKIDTKGNGKIAVYLDNSGSMIPYLADVKKEIYEKFPTADIFEHNGIVTILTKGKVAGGRDYKFTARARIRHSHEKSTLPTPKKLSLHGSAIYGKYAKNFDAGSVGAWADILQHDNYYGALVVFSDFQDGIRTSKGQTAARTTNAKNKSPDTWDESWARQFAKAKEGKAPRLYLFSIQREPQEVWKRCVEASGGEIKMMLELRKEKKKAQRKESSRKKENTQQKETPKPKEKNNEPAPKDASANP